MFDTPTKRPVEATASASSDRRSSRGAARRSPSYPTRGSRRTSPRSGASSTSSSWKRSGGSARSSVGACSNGTGTSRPPGGSRPRSRCRGAWRATRCARREPWTRCRPPAPRSRRARSPCAPHGAWSLRAMRIPPRSPPRSCSSSKPRASTRSATSRVVAYWRQAVERERGIDGEEALRAQRRLHTSVTMHGMVRVDGTLDPETGETVLTALRAVVDAETLAQPRGEADDRSPAQRRTDALGEVCRQWLDRLDRPTVGGELPHVTVTVSADTLASGDGVCELDHVGPIPVGTVRRLACDASVMRVVLSGRSQPLDVGRRSKVVPPSMRRALFVRDRHCRFPGCDRPHTWCDAHHVVHWAHGGPTALSNLILLCRQHHHAIHAGRARLDMDDGLPVFRRPDGSRLALRLARHPTGQGPGRRVPPPLEAAQRLAPCERRSVDASRAEALCPVEADQSIFGRFERPKGSSIKR